MEKNKIIIKEGLAKIQVSDDVFYNNKMKNLRDISVLFVKFFGDAQATVLDSTCATGIRGIRYLKEAGVKNVVFLDINKSAAENTRNNLKLNKIKNKVKNISIQEFCAGPERGIFNFIDLDPFGSPQPHINDIMRVAQDGSYLMITATDTAVLCGAHANACIKSYGAEPIHNELCKESGIRILLGYIARVTASFNFGVEPILSISDMHYMRVFLRVVHGAQKAVSSMKELGFVSFCNNCRSFEYAKGLAPILNNKCNFCKKNLKFFGPMYLGSINDKNSIDKLMLYNANNRIITESDNMDKLLLKISNELDELFFYSIPKITKSIGYVSVSPEEIIKKLQTYGFKTSKTQFDKDGIKTNAKITEIKKILDDIINAK